MPALPNVMDLFRLDGRSALVTGGTRGLGRVMAEALAEAGASVCITSRSIDAARTAAEEIAAASGARVEGIEAEVTTADGVNHLADVAHRNFERIDILVNNAGVNIRGTVGELSESDWDTV